MRTFHAASLHAKVIFSIMFQLFLQFFIHIISCPFVCYKILFVPVFNDHLFQMFSDSNQVILSCFFDQLTQRQMFFDITIGLDQLNTFDKLILEFIFTRCQNRFQHFHDGQSQLDPAKLFLLPNKIQNIFDVTPRKRINVETQKPLKYPQFIRQIQLLNFICKFRRLLAEHAPKQLTAQPSKRKIIFVVSDQHQSRMCDCCYESFDGFQLVHLNQNKKPHHEVDSLDVALLRKVKSDLLQSVLEHGFIGSYLELWLIGVGSIDVLVDLYKRLVIVFVSHAARSIVLYLINLEQFEPFRFCYGISCSQCLEIITFLIFFSHTIPHFLRTYIINFKLKTRTFIKIFLIHPFLKEPKPITVTKIIRPCFKVVLYFLRIIMKNILRMKLKLKQSNSNDKQLLLPYLKNNHPRNYTPRHRPNNRSLTKIPQLPQHEPHAHPPLRSKIMSYDKPQRMQKMRSAHQKKKIQTPGFNHDDTFSSSNQLEYASIQEITYNLKKEIQKNLVFIKKEKENRKKMGLMAARPRYRTPRHQTQQNETIDQMVLKPNKCVTEQHEVFAKINQIITKSQSKSRHIIEEPAPISYSSYISKGKLSNSFASIEDNIQYSKPVKTEPTCAEHNRHSNKQIKNSHNYHEWRKVSIDQGENSKMVSYNLSSYDNEADRLEKIRNKNELSLKKYIQGKSYLSKLIKYRDSANLLPKEK